jgi:hypothetical protein
MVVGHIMLLITAQSTDPVLVESLLCIFLRFRGSGAVRVAMREDWARYNTLSLVVVNGRAGW